MQEDYNKLIEKLFEDSDWSGIISLCTKILEKDEKDIFAYFRRAVAHYNLQELELCLQDAERMKELAPDEYRGYDWAGGIYFELNQCEKAIENFNKVLELNPEYAAAYNNRGASKYSLAEKPGDISDYDKSLELYKKY